jgi:general secretion pathway protein G
MLCPSCRKVMHVPPSHCRKDGPRSAKRHRLSPELSQKKRELGTGVVGGAVAWTHVTRHPRYVGALVVLFVAMGIILTQQATRHNTERVSRRDPIGHAMSDLVTLRTALDLFRQDCGRFPSTRESLVALLRHPGAKGWDGPYIRTLFPDPWKHAYRYTMVRGAMRLTSDGPDGIPDTVDDLAPPLPDASVTAPIHPGAIPGRTSAPVP